MQWFILTTELFKNSVIIVGKHYQSIFWLVLKLSEVGIQEIKLNGGFYFTLCHQNGLSTHLSATFFWSRHMFSPMAYLACDFSAWGKKCKSQEIKGFCKLPQENHVFLFFPGPTNIEPIRAHPKRLI